MYKMTANFYPAQEPKNGYIGRASITIADAFRINSISVFKKEGKFNVQFPGYEVVADGKEQQISYVTPDSKEVYASMIKVVKMAVADKEHHFGHKTGKYNPKLEVSGKEVNEQYADGRYTLKIDGVCTMTGITTQEVKGEDEKAFIAVHTPTVGKYKDKEDKTRYVQAFEGLTSKFERDGKEESKNFGLLMRNLVLDERKKFHEAEKEQSNPSVDEKMNDASARAKESNAEKSAPEKAEQEPVIG